MTTTPEIPEQIVTTALDAAYPIYTTRHSLHDVATVVVSALKAHGRLVGAPTEEQIKTGAAVVDEAAMNSPQDYPLAYEAAMQMSRDVLLAAAGAAPQEHPSADPMDEAVTTYWICGTCGAKEHLRGAVMATGPKHTCEGEPSPSEPGECSDDGCLHYDHSPAPSSDREKLIDELKVWAAEPAPEAGDVVPGKVLQSVAKRALAALTAAAPVLDEAKLAEVLREHAWDYGACMCGKGHDDLAEHQASEVAEALRGGGR